MKYIEEYSLFEHTVKLAKKEFVDTSLISSSTFDFFRGNDPTNNKKYVYWMCKVRSNDDDIMSQHILDLAEWFDTNKQKFPINLRDINKLSATDIEKMQQDPKYRSKKERKADLKSDKNYVILYEDSKGNKIIKPLNHSGCVYWTQLDDDKLEPASFCIGAYGGKNEYKNYTKHRKLGLNDTYMLILPNEKPKYRKIVLTPSLNPKDIYDITDINNTTSRLSTIFSIQWNKGDKEAKHGPIDNNTIPNFFDNIYRKYSFISKHILNINTVYLQYVNQMKLKGKKSKHILNIIKEAQLKYGSTLKSFGYFSSPIYALQGVETGSQNGLMIELYFENYDYYLSFHGGDILGNLINIASNSMMIPDYLNQKPKDVIKIIHDSYIQKEIDFNINFK